MGARLHSTHAERNSPSGGAESGRLRPHPRAGAGGHLDTQWSLRYPIYRDGAGGLAITPHWGLAFRACGHRAFFWTGYEFPAAWKTAITSAPRVSYNLSEK